jgi:hypothetical protein
VSRGHAEVDVDELEPIGFFYLLIVPGASLVGAAQIDDGANAVFLDVPVNLSRRWLRGPIQLPRPHGAEVSGELNPAKVAAPEDNGAKKPNPGPAQMAARLKEGPH